MDVRNSGMVIGLYVLLGVAVVAIGVLSWQLFRPDDLADQLALSPEPIPTSVTGSNPRQSAYLTEKRQAFVEASRQVKQLETILERQRDLLDRKTELLEQRTEEYDKLRAEADRYLMALIDELDATSPASDSDKTTSGEESRNALQAELKRLRDDLAASELLEEALESELGQLREDLAAAQEVLAETQMEQLAADVTRPLASEALLRLEAEAVPVLVASLRDERADIRAWAAGMLAQLGPTAADAVPDLNTARNDTNSDVREAATMALAAINRSDR